MLWIEVEIQVLDGNNSVSLAYITLCSSGFSPVLSALRKCFSTSAKNSLFYHFTSLALSNLFVLLKLLYNF